MITTKTADSKGRVSLGPEFANRTVIIQPGGPGEIRVSLARVVPEREAWLFENAPARESVTRGLREARDRKLSRGPNLKADARRFRSATGEDD